MLAMVADVGEAIFGKVEGVLNFVFLLADARFDVCQRFSPIRLFRLNALGNANRVDYGKLGVEATKCAGLISACQWSLCILICRLTIEPRDCY
jgi:hypothetical protein